MKVLITGADGFIGRNLSLRLSAGRGVDLLFFARSDKPDTLFEKVRGVDFVFHLAGTNRPDDPADFLTDNVELTRKLCSALAAEARATGRRLSLVFSSSIQAVHENAYGLSKLATEELLRDLQRESAVSVRIFRLPNVFGKWARPNYNSVVATFCHNIARGLPVRIDAPTAPLTLVHVDDVIDTFLGLLQGELPPQDPQGFAKVLPEYSTTVGELARQIMAFRDSRATLLTDRVGKGLVRALYATYVSYLPPEAFAYPLVPHADSRGLFVEMLRTSDSGQFSFFTAHPGVTRGGHYHHAKTEKFLVVRGEARFRFRHMQTGQTHELLTSGSRPEVVESVPGWTHDITNVGDDEMIVMLWANELFDPDRPDTYACPL